MIGTTPSEPLAVASSTRLPGSRHRLGVELLSIAGIPVPRGVTGAGPGEVARAAMVAGLRYPLVVKGLSDAVPHKSDHGLVRLSISDEAELHDALDKVAATELASELLVEEMEQPPYTEAVLVVTRDPEFGLVLGLGLGGVDVELVDDVRFLQLPCTADEFGSVLAATRLGRALSGHRAAPDGDVDALRRAARGLATAFAAMPETVRAVEVNPLLVRTAGSGAVAVDVLVETSEKAGDDSE